MSAFNVAAFQQALQTRVIGRHCHYFAVLPSTNTTARLLGDQGTPEGTVVLADAQTAGRGQIDRVWISPPGCNVYVSILLRPPFTPARAPLLSLLPAVALVDCFRQEGVGCGIKWPNDVLIRRRKVAGILTEMEANGDVVRFVVVGIGININMTQADLDRYLGPIAFTATSLQVALGREVSREILLAALLGNLERWYDILRTEGDRALCDAWLERSLMRGRRILVRTSGATLEGTAQGIDQAGCLLLRQDDGTLIALRSAEVRFVD